MTGIYKITNPEGSVYIGGSTNLLIRRQKYKYAAKTLRNQPKIYSSIMYYGWGAHKWDVCHQLPSDVSKEVLTRYEQLYIDIYSHCGVALLNIKGAGSEGKHSEESKEKMSRKRKGGSNARARLVIDKNTGKVYGCAKDAASDFGLNYWTLTKYLNGGRINITTLKYLS